MAQYKTIKGFIGIMAAICFIFILTSCNWISDSPGTSGNCKQLGVTEKRSYASPEKITVGLSIASYQEERWLTDKDIFAAKCSELGAEVIVLSANGNADLQEVQCRKLISQQVDVLVIVPHDGEKAAVIVNEASKMNIPVVAYDRLIRNCPLSGFVSYDNIMIGELQAEYLLNKVPRGNYVLLGGAQTDYNSIQIREGQMRRLRPYIDSGQIKVIGESWVKDWNPSEAREIIDGILIAGNRIHAVLASNDGIAGGAIQKLAERRLAGKVAVSGQDADLAGCQRIVEGTQSMTVYAPISTEAEYCAEAAVRLAQGADYKWNGSVHNGKISVPALLLVPVSVDKVNLVNTVIMDGYQKFEDVFKNIPNQQWPTQK